MSMLRTVRGKVRLSGFCDNFEHGSSGLVFVPRRLGFQHLHHRGTNAPMEQATENNIYIKGGEGGGKQC